MISRIILCGTARNFPSAVSILGKTDATAVIRQWFGAEKPGQTYQPVNSLKHRAAARPSVKAEAAAQLITPGQSQAI